MASSDPAKDRKRSVVTEREQYPEATGEGLPEATVIKISKISSTLSILVAGLALFSDGYNAQISKTESFRY